MKKWYAAVSAVSMALVACSEPPPSQTAIDALEEGYAPVYCSESRTTPVYVRADSVSVSVACAALETALSILRDSSLVRRSAVSDDSVRLAVVSTIELLPVSSQPDSVAPGFAVTIELRGLSRNLTVSWMRMDTVFDIGWVAAGLKY